ncbi:MAG: YaaR family protein [Clostridia bacterium]|nr:YaaR family protein [Clostridia bacterium]
MKITGNNISDVNQLNVNIKKNVSASSINFGEALENASESNHRETVIELTKSILEQGDIIAKRCDIKELKKYKELISSFFNEIVSNGFKFSKEGKLDERGRKKLYANIKKVDADMEILATELLKEQRDQILILKTVEDIRGIILDTLI